MYDPNQYLVDANTNAYEHTQNKFEADYGSGFIDNSFQSNINTFGYNEAAFGNDPLSKAHLYQCPKFTNLVWVDAYIKDDGTLVDGHFRTAPDDTTINNLK